VLTADDVGGAVSFYRNALGLGQLAVGERGRVLCLVIRTSGNRLGAETLTPRSFR
jgi:hypothetical protein